MFGKHSSSQTSEPAQFPQALARVIEDGEKHIYRAIKKDNGYIARIKENDIIL